MGHVHGRSEEVFRVLERSLKNPLKIRGKGGIFWVAGEESDVCVVEPVQRAA